MDPDSGSDLIRCLKPHPGNVVRKLVGILLHHFIESGSVIFINFHCKRGRNSILLQKDHGLPHVPFFFHLHRNLLGLPFADPLNFGQTLRLLLHNPKRILLKPAHNASCKRRADPLYRSGTQVALNGHQIFRLLDLMGEYFKLCSVYAVVHVFPFQLQKLTLRNIVKAAHTGHLSIVTFQVEYRISVFLIPKHDMIHISCYCLQNTLPLSSFDQEL